MSVTAGPCSTGSTPRPSGESSPHESQAWRAVRGDLPGRWVLLRRQRPQRLPVCCGDQPEGLQRYNAFVLRYRAGHGGMVATQDLAAALSYIFENAKTLGVSTSDYSLWGSSAGARMAAAIGSHGVATYGGSKLPKPAAIVTAYTAHSDHSSDEPPTFVVVGERDGIAPPSIMERRVAALRRSGTDVEYRRYPDLGHGFGPGVGTSAEGWIGEATRFWERFIRKENRDPSHPKSEGPREIRASGCRSARPAPSRR